MIYSTPTVGDEEQAAIGRIEDLRSQLKPYVAEGRHRWVGVLGRMLAARAIQGSNSIEGYVVSDEDALALSLIHICWARHLISSILSSRWRMSTPWSYRAPNWR